MLIDTHAHIYLPQFEEDIDEVMKRASHSGVEKILLPNIDLESVPQMKNLIQQYPDVCIGMMGLHPCSVDENYIQVLESLEKELREGKYIAVGEIGIDLYWDKTFLSQQKDAFRIQIDWAKELSLPIAIHARDSFDEIFEVLDAENDDRLSGVFHCFTGSTDQAQRVLDYGGFKLGIGGVYTFKNSGLREALTPISTEHFILETDAPYLTPAPYRGKRNEPSYTRLVAEKMAEVYGESISEVERITSMNAQQLFQIQ
jgi:TatD DNase family protein